MLVVYRVKRETKILKRIVKEPSQKDAFESTFKRINGFAFDQSSRLVRSTNALDHLKAVLLREITWVTFSSSGYKDIRIGIERRSSSLDSTRARIKIFYYSSRHFWYFNVTTRRCWLRESLFYRTIILWRTCNSIIGKRSKRTIEEEKCILRVKGF